MHNQLKRRVAHHLKDPVGQWRVTVGADFPDDVAVRTAKDSEGGGRDGGRDSVGGDSAGGEEDVGLGRGATPGYIVEDARMEGKVVRG